jgi:hypothetical protein
LFTRASSTAVAVLSFAGLSNDPELPASVM